MKSLTQHISENLFESILTSTEGELTSKDGEKLTCRIYDDGGVKIEGQNIKKDFSSTKEAEKFIKANNINEAKEIAVPKYKAMTFQELNSKLQKYAKQSKNKDKGFGIGIDFDKEVIRGLQIAIKTLGYDVELLSSSMRIETAKDFRSTGIAAKHWDIRSKDPHANHYQNLVGNCTVDYLGGRGEFTDKSTMSLICGPKDWKSTPFISTDAINYILQCIKVEILSSGTELFYSR